MVLLAYKENTFEHEIRRSGVCSWTLDLLRNNSRGEDSNKRAGAPGGAAARRGDLSKPLQTHGETPDGVADLKRLKSSALGFRNYLRRLSIAGSAASKTSPTAWRLFAETCSSVSSAVCHCG